MILVRRGEPSPFLTAMWDILEKILTLAVILGAVAALCAFLFWLYKKYNSQVPDNGDILEKLETPEKETRERMKKKGIFFVPDFLKSRTPKARIRKAYRRKIEAAGKPSAFASPKGTGRSGGHSPGRKKRRISQVI